MTTGPAATACVLLALWGAGLFAWDADAKVDARSVWSDESANHLGAPSRDGKYLSCVDTATGDLAVRVLATGEMRRLTNKNLKRQDGQFAYFSSISPDNRSVAYAWFNEKKFYELRVVGMDGTGEKQLFRNSEAGFVQPCAWSPNSDEILTLLFRKDNISQIAMVSAADGSLRVLKSLSWFYPKKMDLSPDGRFIAYDSLERPDGARRDIMLLAADGSAEVKLVENPANDTYPMWSPDGGSVIFLSDRSGSLDVWKIRVQDGRPAGEAEELLRGLGRILPMGLTRDGDYYFGLKTGLTDIFTAALDAESGSTGKASLVTTRYRGVNSAPAWSPDGKQLAFLSVRGTENYGQASRLIVVRDLTAGGERELPTRMSHIGSLRWSPSGDALLVSGSDRRERNGLFVANAETGRTTPVALDENADLEGLAGVWSPGGTSVYYLDGAEVRQHNLETGKEEVVYRHTSVLYYPAMAPDGLRLALASKNGAVLVLPLKSAQGSVPEPSLIPTPAKGYLAGLEWTRSGDRLLMAIGGDQGETVWAVPLEEGLPRKLDLPKELRGGVQAHPDGASVAFTAGRPKTEIWFIERILSRPKEDAEAPR